MEATNDDKRHGNGALSGFVSSHEAEAIVNLYASLQHHRRLTGSAVLDKCSLQEFVTFCLSFR